MHNLWQQLTSDRSLRSVTVLSLPTVEGQLTLKALPVHTVAEKCDFSATQRRNSATVALFCDSVDRL